MIFIKENRATPKLKRICLLLDIILSSAAVAYTGFYISYNKKEVYIFLLIIEILIGMYVYIVITDIKYKSVLYGFCLFCFILVGCGYLIVSLTKIFPGGKDIMLIFFSVLISSLVGAGIAVFGSIYGVKISSERSLKGIMEVLKEQKNVELHEKEKMRIEKATYIQSIILTFLNKEIEKNYEILDISGEKNLPIGTVFKLQFDEYEKTKYLLLENPTRSVREINKLYSLFDDILQLNDNNKIQDKIKKLDEIIEQKDMVDILLSEVKYTRNV